MHADLLLLQQMAEGLLYLSEGDYPFEVVDLGAVNSTVAEKLVEISGKTGVEKVALPYFFRNMTKAETGAGEESLQKATRFVNLQNALQQKLADVAVYRLGSVQVSIYIIGRLPDGAFGGLKSTSIET